MTSSKATGGALADDLAGIELDTSPEALAAANRDFGGLVQGSSRGVVRPTTRSQVLELVQRARHAGLRLTPRGRGLSQSGQSVAVDSLTVDLGGLSRLDEPDATKRTLSCGAGATWRAALARAAAAGLIPKVMPLNLDLTIGGTLSAGGFGSTSHVAGLAVSNIASGQVVLGRGESLRCSRDSERGVYDAVFGGLGRCGIITDVELELRPLKQCVRTCFLSYASIDDLLHDQALLTAQGRADHLEGFCAASVLGFRKHESKRRVPLVRWSYVLHVSREYDETPPAQTEMCDGLACQEVLHVEDDDALGFASRYDGRFDVMRGLGAWDQPHPWLEMLLPSAVAAPCIGSSLQHVPVFLGDIHRIMIIANRDRPKAVAFPAGAAPVIGFAVVPMGVPPLFKAAALDAIRGLHALGLRAGGKRYLSGWLPEMNSEHWQAHYADSYGSLVESQRLLDPSAVFSAALPGLV